MGNHRSKTANIRGIYLAHNMLLGLNELILILAHNMLLLISLY
jgi:hypothetical protein